MVKDMISREKTRFGLIRHATTQWNLEKRIQGKNDPGLCPEGIEQVQKWGKIVKDAETWDRIMVSGLRRTWETAEIINKDLNLPIEKDPRLNEQDWGEWNGKTYQDLMLETPQELMRQMASGWHFCPPEGEDRLSVWMRSLSAFHDMSIRWPGQKILVVCHGGVIRTLVNGTLKRNFLPDEACLIKPYHLHILTWKSDRLDIEVLNAVGLD
jgi:broad specificity phosphatase PhoE